MTAVYRGMCLFCISWLTAILKSRARRLMKHVKSRQYNLKKTNKKKTVCDKRIQEYHCFISWFCFDSGLNFHIHCLVQCRTCVRWRLEFETTWVLVGLSAHRWIQSYWEFLQLQTFQKLHSLFFSLTSFCIYFFPTKQLCEVLAFRINAILQLISK